MFKWIATIKKKRGMNRADFIAYYEGVHVPLLKKLLPPFEIYRRNYLLFDDPILNVDGRGGGDDDADFDVMTECMFNSRAEAQAVMDAMARPEILRKVQEDEANFVDPTKTKLFIVEVHESERGSR